MEFNGKKIMAAALDRKFEDFENLLDAELTQRGAAAVEDLKPAVVATLFGESKASAVMSPDQMDKMAQDKKKAKLQDEMDAFMANHPSYGQKSDAAVKSRMNEGILDTIAGAITGRHTINIPGGKLYHDERSGRSVAYVDHPVQHGTKHIKTTYGSRPSLEEHMEHVAAGTAALRGVAGETKTHSDGTGDTYHTTEITHAKGKSTVTTLDQRDSGDAMNTYVKHG